MYWSHSQTLSLPVSLASTLSKLFSCASICIEQISGNGRDSSSTRQLLTLMHLSFPKVFLTVGTTEFDALVAVAVDSPELVDALATLYGCKHIVMQIGRGQREPHEAAGHCKRRGILFEWYRFKESILPDVISSDLVISHCGAGTILEVLKHSKPLIVVVNETLQGIYRAIYDIHFDQHNGTHAHLLLHTLQPTTRQSLPMPSVQAATATPPRPRACAPCCIRCTPRPGLTSTRHLSSSCPSQHRI